MRWQLKLKFCTLHLKRQLQQQQQLLQQCENANGGGHKNCGKCCRRRQRRQASARRRRCMQRGGGGDGLNSCGIDVPCLVCQSVRLYMPPSPPLTSHHLPLFRLSVSLSLALFELCFQCCGAQRVAAFLHSYAPLYGLRPRPPPLLVLAIPPFLLALTFVSSTAADLQLKTKHVFATMTRAHPQCCRR